MSIFDAEELKQIVGDPRQTIETLERYCKDIKYFSSNRERLTMLYPDNFVAIMNEQVIGHGRIFFGLVERL